jgi:general secretion pathway protein H
MRKGFTLLEILVAMMIMGIVLSFATLSIDHSGEIRLMQREARRLAAVLTLASQEAVLQAKEIGVLLENRQYQFYVLEDQQWQPLKKDEVLRLHALPARLRLDLHLEGESIVFKALESEPQLLLLSSGEVSLFEIALSSELENRVRYRVTNYLTGQIRVERDETL